MVNKSTDQVSLETVSRQINKWRDTKQTGDKIPDHIWNHIFDVAPKYPRNVICKQLGISSYQFKTHLKRLGRMGQVYSDPVELCQIPAVTTKNIINSKNTPNITSPLHTMVVEYVRKDGFIMRIHTTSVVLVELIQSFFGATINATDNI